METNTFSFTYDEYRDPGELGDDDRELINAARDAARNAYAPYSGFRVGAAVRLASGKIECGTNVENAAFPSGICAERNVLSTVVSNHPDDYINTMAIAAISTDGYTGEPVTPCGNCRQVVAEEEARTGRKIRIILSGNDKTLVIDGIASLLPLQFSKNSLRINLP